MGKQVLLINDLPGCGKVALAAMMPVLVRMGCGVSVLPTALVSNTLDYGKFALLDTTAYMKETIAVWKALDFSFDAVAAGFLASDEQAEIAAAYGAEAKARGAYLFVDPIMGDEGRLYNGVPASRVAAMRRLCAGADCISPNYTEAALLAGEPYAPEGLTAAAMRALIDKLRALGAASAVVTSAKVDGADAVAGYDGQRGAYFVRPFTPIPVRFPGTGDIFSAILLGRLLREEPLEAAAQAAMDGVAALIARHRNCADPWRGIPLELSMEVLD